MTLFTKDIFSDFLNLPPPSYFIKYLFKEKEANVKTVVPGDAVKGTTETEKKTVFGL